MQAKLAFQFKAVVPQLMGDTVFSRHPSRALLLTSSKIFPQLVLVHFPSLKKWWHHALWPTKTTDFLCIGNSLTQHKFLENTFPYLCQEATDASSVSVKMSW